MSMRKGEQSNPSPLSFKMTLTKSSQKRLRNDDEESEDILPRTKRREYFFSSCDHCPGNKGTDLAGEPHQTRVASASSTHEGLDSTNGLLHSPTNPVVGGAMAPHLPQNSADITFALHNTHLGRRHYHPQLSSLPPYNNDHHYHHQQQQYQQAPYMDHPSLLKDAGVPQPLPQNSLGPLPDVVHETTEDYYCHVNRLLRSAHFERLKRERNGVFSGDTHD